MSIRWPCFMYFLIFLIFCHHILRISPSVLKKGKNKTKKFPHFHKQRRQHWITFYKVIVKVSVFFLHLILMKPNIERYFFQQEMTDIKAQHSYKVKWDIEIDLLNKKWTDTITIMYRIWIERKGKNKVLKRKRYQDWKESCL